MSGDKIAISVQNTYKSFKLPLEKNMSIKSAVVNFWNRKKGYELQKALDNISFEVNEGEFFGIVGRNGSGKSTMLKLLAGIYSPTKGDIQVNGKLIPFIELGVGFNPELTGRENVFLNGALLGFNRKEMAAMYDDIVEFAEIERFMDQKLKNYSSGMQVRLAFSIAIRAKGDILLLDEVLAVGDSVFQQKCYDYFYRLKQEKKTVVFVSHDMDAVQKFCDRALLIDKGKMITIGKADYVIDKYVVGSFKEASGNKKQNSGTANEDIQDASLLKSFSIKIKSSQPLYTPNDKMLLDFQYELIRKNNVQIRVALLKDGIAGAHINSNTIKLKNNPGKHRVECTIGLENLLDGKHSIVSGLYDADTGRTLAYVSGSTFYVECKDTTRSGMFKLDYEWNNAT